MNTCRLLGLKFSGLDVRALTSALLTKAASPSSSKAQTVIFVNPHSIVVAKSNPLFKQAIDTCDFLVNDGVGISIFSALICRCTPPRIPGYDGFISLLAGMNGASSERRKFRIGFFGATNSTLEKIKQKIEVEFPNLIVAVSIAPPFGDWPPEVNRMFLSEINKAEIDVLFIGMTAPRQETWAHNHRNSLNVKCILSIGAVFDFYAGTISRPNKWLGKYGLEWLGRLMAEPRRLWRRTFISAPMFIWYCVKYHLFRQF